MESDQQQTGEPRSVQKNKKAVLIGDDMLVSYYSSHEGATSVYLAIVPLKR